MASHQFLLQNKGIFKNLPTFSPDVKGLTAIVTGANGISGFHTMRVLLESPERWTKVYAASRRPPPKEMMDLLPQDQRDRVEHVALDFLSKPEEIAKGLEEANVKADVVFFYSYAQPKPAPGSGAWSNAQELTDVNSTLLRNFLDALPQANISPKRILLQTGAKNYGIHLGPARTPFVESDPRVTLEPNFYYPQEDTLFKYCQDHPGTSWNIICPAWIIGATTNASMNAHHPLAVYASTCAAQNAPLAYPGDYTSWLACPEHSSAKLTGYLSEWAVLSPHCANHKFNASDGCPLPPNRFWPELARWFGCPRASGPELDESLLTTVHRSRRGETTPLGYGPAAKSTFSFTLTDWAREPANHETWKGLMGKHGLTSDPFEDVEAHFPFGDAAAWGGGMALSMNKARGMGWTGHVDTMESLFAAFREMGRVGMVPPMAVEEANALV